MRSQFGYLSAEISRVYQCVSLCILQLCKISNCRNCQEKQFRFCNKSIWIFMQKLFQSRIHPFLQAFWKYVRQDVWQFCVCMFLTVAKPFLWSFCIIQNCTVSWTNWIVAFFLWWDSIPFFVLLFSTRHQIDLSFQYQKPFLKLNFEVHRKWFRFRKPQEKHPFLYRSRRSHKNARVFYFHLTLHKPF